VRPTEVLVPDELWRNRNLTDGAKRLWCYLVAVAKRHQFAFHELRKVLRISQNSLVKYLASLAEHGWLSYRKTGLRSVHIEVARPHRSAAVKVPTDLLLDHDLPRASIWVWCLIRRHGGPFGYQRLRELTGYSQPTLSKYIRILRDRGWLEGSQRRVNRFVEFDLQAQNPQEIRRKAEIAQLEQGLELARRTEGYSQAQYIVARMLMLSLAEGSVVENAEVTGLDNPLTGGRMHWDAYVPEYKVAIEFHGPQHDRPTERYSDPEAYRSQRVRDLLKLGLATELGVRVVVLRVEDLSFERLWAKLDGLVPLKKDLDDQWHLKEYLERVAARYRRKVAVTRRVAQ